MVPTRVRRPVTKRGGEHDSSASAGTCLDSLPARHRRRAAQRLAIDTSSVDPEQRFDLWQEAANEHIHPMNLSRSGGSSFDGRLGVAKLGGIEIFRISSDPLTVARTVQTIKRGDREDLHLLFVLSGEIRVSQGGRVAPLGAGEISGHGTWRPYSIVHNSRFDVLLFGIPRASIIDIDSIDRATATTIRTDSALSSLARPFLHNLYRGVASGALDADDAGLVDVVGALANSLITQVQRAMPTGHVPSLYPALLRYIDEHLADADLTPQSLARAHFISLRQLHNVFAAHGRTPAAVIREKRLRACMTDLADPALEHLGIGEIAARWGFRSPAHFSTVFRRQTGASPRDYRADRLRGA